MLRGRGTSRKPAVGHESPLVHTCVGDGHADPLCYWSVFWACEVGVVSGVGCLARRWRGYGRDHHVETAVAKAGFSRAVRRSIGSFWFAHADVFPESIGWSWGFGRVFGSNIGRGIGGLRGGRYGEREQHTGHRAASCGCIDRWWRRYGPAGAGHGAVPVEDGIAHFWIDGGVSGWGTGHGVAGRS